MEQDGHSKSLAERMKEKAEQERIQTENIFKEQLQTLKDNLLASSQNALRTMSDAITADMEMATANLSQHFQTLSIAYGRAWMRTAITAFAMMLGLTAGGWALARAGSWNLERYRAILEQLKQDCQAQREEHRILTEAVEVLSNTFTTLRDATSGVAIVERNGVRYLTAPQGSESGHTINGRPAIKLKE